MLWGKSAACYFISLISCCSACNLAFLDTSSVACAGESQLSQGPALKELSALRCKAKLLTGVYRSFSVALSSKEIKQISRKEKPKAKKKPSPHIKNSPHIQK